MTRTIALVGLHNVSLSRSNLLTALSLPDNSLSQPPQQAPPMPTLVRWTIKAALIHFMLALIAGLLLALNRVLPFVIPSLSPVYFHLLMLGWVTQLIFGVAYWMFPRFSKESARGPEWVGWGVLILLNVGLALRAIGEPLQSSQPRVGGVMLAASAVSQLAAGWGFIALIWSRVRER
jgi:hypothetical protein